MIPLTPILTALLVCGALSHYKGGPHPPEHITQDPYTCLGQSSKDWSCARMRSPEQLEARDPTRFGFSEEDVLPGKHVGQTRDTTYTKHIPDQEKNHRVTDGPGFLHFKLPAEMYKGLRSWFEAHNNDEYVKPEAMIGGGYTNQHKVPTDFIDLDDHREVRKQVVDSIQPIMEWWTGQPLIHVATYGVRIYRNDSMLMQHVDRKDTHIASIVVQVAQDVDEGWPLQVDLKNGSSVEVYLQPGDGVLYEGSVFMHGRPSRSRGRFLANIFGHFKPYPKHNLVESDLFDEVGPGTCWGGAGTRIGSPLQRPTVEECAKWAMAETRCSDHFEVDSENHNWCGCGSLGAKCKTYADESDPLHGRWSSTVYKLKPNYHHTGKFATSTPETAKTHSDL